METLNLLQKRINLFTMKLLIIILILYLIILIPVVLLGIYEKKHTSFLISVLFGKPGAGKSTIGVKEAIKHHNKGIRLGIDFPVYVNYPMNLPFVKMFDTDDFGTFPEEGLNPDFKGQILMIIDEANISFSNRAWKNFSYYQNRFLKLHRHRKIHCLLMSQGWDIDSSFRSLATKLYFMTRLGPFSIIRPIRKHMAIKQASESNDADSQLVDNLELLPIITLFPPKINVELNYIPKYTKYFDSFELPSDALAMPYTDAEGNKHNLDNHDVYQALKKLKK